jgi:hypothetical protein
VRGALPASGMLSRWSRRIPNAHNAHEDTSKMSAVVAESDGAFVIFGA